MSMQDPGYQPDLTDDRKSRMDEIYVAEGDCDKEQCDEDLSADGPTARRIRAELAALIALPSAMFRISETEDGRGKGLYATAHIEAGSYLFDYKGEVLEEDEANRRYPPGVIAEYTVAVGRADGSMTYVDGVNPKLSNLARYMNHDDADPSVAMWTLSEPAPRLLYFALQDIAPGMELTWDYGESYWRERKDKI